MRLEYSFLEELAAEVAAAELDDWESAAVLLEMVETGRIPDRDWAWRVDAKGAEISGRSPNGAAWVTVFDDGFEISQNGFRVRFREVDGRPKWAANHEGLTRLLERAMSAQSDDRSW